MKDQRKQSRCNNQNASRYSDAAARRMIAVSFLLSCFCLNSLQAFTTTPTANDFRTYHQTGRAVWPLSVAHAGQDFDHHHVADNKYTIQILMSDTGGGHRASANALRDAFDVLYPGKIECDIVDIYTDYGPYWPWNGYVAGYKLMARYPWTWGLFYHFGATPFGLWLNELLLDQACFDPFTNCLNRKQPYSSASSTTSTAKRADMVVSVHPLCQDLPLKILAALDADETSKNTASSSSSSSLPRVPLSERTTPFCTVVTDLGGAHPTWFHSGVDKCFVPSNALYKAARDRQLQHSQIVQYGLPIRKGFWAAGGNAEHVNEASTLSENKAAMRNYLGLENAQVPTVLVVGGGDGMGGIVDIAIHLGSKLGKTRKTQLVVVCGNNQEAKQKLEAHSWNNENVKVYIKGFVNNMDEWMKASDALVTKAGPGTIAEASICGLPCMLFSYLPGQEEGNIPFVEEAGFGTYSADPTVIAETVSSWLESPTKLSALQHAALQAARPEATLDIARDLAEMVFATKKNKAEYIATKTTIELTKQKQLETKAAPTSSNERESVEEEEKVLIRVRM